MYFQSIMKKKLPPLIYVSHVMWKREVYVLHYELIWEYFASWRHPISFPWSCCDKKVFRIRHDGDIFFLCIKKSSVLIFLSFPLTDLMKYSVPVPWLVVTGKTDGGVKLCVVLETDGSVVGRDIEIDHINSFNQANVHKTWQN